MPSSPPSRGHLSLGQVQIVHMAFGDEKAVEFLKEWSGWANYIGRPFLGGVRVFPTLGLHERNIEESAAAADAAFERGHGPVIGFQAEAHLARSFAALGRWKESLDRLNRTRDRLGKDTIDEWADTDLGMGVGRYPRPHGCGRRAPRACSRVPWGLTVVPAYGTKHQTG